jgi:hypothetical protein
MRSSRRIKQFVAIAIAIVAKIAMESHLRMPLLARPPVLCIANTLLVI